jgi:hypothetical protein
MVLRVKLIHRRSAYDLEFDGTASINDVIEKALKVFETVKEPVLLYKGRDLPPHAALAGLADPAAAKPIKLILINKPHTLQTGSTESPAETYSFMRVATISNICRELHVHVQAVRSQPGSRLFE